MAKVDRRTGVSVGLFLVILGTITGCGAKNEISREAVTGNVTLNGTPLERGNIRFIPEQGDEITAGWGKIIDGVYEISADDGPAPGNYTVSITSETFAPPNPDELPGEPLEETPAGTVPDRYNLNSILKATVETGRLNHFDFKLSAKLAPLRNRRR